jgi:hypothetical protein
LIVLYSWVDFLVNQDRSGEISWQRPAAGIESLFNDKIGVDGVFFVLYFMAIILAWLLGRLQPFALSWLDAVFCFRHHANGTNDGI